MLVTPFALSVTDALEAISTHPYICYDRSATGGKLVDDYLRASGIHPRIRLELDGINSIGKLVAEGLGVSILPDTGTLNVGPSGVALWALPEPAMTRSVGILWERNAARAALAAAFCQFISRESPI